MELAFRLLANILTLAAYERARRALRGECEPTALAPKVRRLIRVYELRPQSKHPPRMVGACFGRGSWHFAFR